MTKRKYSLIAAGAVFAILLGLGQSGWPQRALVRWGLVRGLGATRVEASGVSLFTRRPRADRVQVYFNSSAPDHPAIDAQTVNIDYNLSIEQRRHIRLLTFESLHLFYDFNALEGQAQQDSKLYRVQGSNPAREPWYRTEWFPRNLQISTLGGTLIGRGRGCSVDGVSLKLASGWFMPSFSLTGDNVQVDWWMGPNAPRRTARGVVDIRMQSNENGISLMPATIELGDFMSAHGSAQGSAERGRSDFSARLKDLHLGAVDLAQSGVFPVAFDQLDISDARFDGVVAAIWTTVGSLSMNGRARNLRVGLPGNLLYEGDVEVVSRKQESKPGCALELTLNRGQKMNATLVGDSGEIESKVGFAGWTREQWRAIVPRNLQKYADWTPGLRTASGAFEATYALGGIYVKGTLTPAIDRAGAETPQPVNFEIAAPPRWSSDNRHVTASTKFPWMGNKSGVQLECVWTPDSSPSAEIELTDISPAQALSAVGAAGIEPLEKFGGNLTGKVNVRSVGVNTRVGMNLRAPEFSYGGFPIFGGEPVTAVAEIDCGTAFQDFTIPNMDLTLGSVGRLNAGGTAVSLSPLSIDTHASAKIDLAKLGAAMNLYGVEGTLDLKFPAKYADNMLRSQVTGTISNLRTGAGTVPLDMPAVLTGVVSYDAERREARIEKFDMRLDAGPAVTIADGVFDLQSGNAHVPIAAQSDLAILTRTGWLAGATGQITVKGAVSRTEGVWGGVVDIDLQAAALTLPNKMASLAGVGFKGNLSCDAVWAGSGKAGVASASVAGAALREITGTVDFGKDGLQCNDLTAALFGGAVKAEFRVGGLSSLAPVSLAGTLNEIDLDVFTREFKPSGAALTGLVGGEFAVKFDGGSLADFRIALRSVGGITVNRDLIEQLLVSGAVKGFTGAKTLERVMSQIVGASEQRAFDRADLSLAYQEGALKGQAGLHSKDLNLTIDLTMDPAALKAAMELRQQTQLENVAAISTNPV